MKSAALGGNRLSAAKLPCIYEQLWHICRDDRPASLIKTLGLDGPVFGCSPTRPRQVGKTTLALTLSEQLGPEAIYDVSGIHEVSGMNQDVTLR